MWDKVKAKVSISHLAAAAYSSLLILHSPLLTACTGHTVAHCYKPLPAAGWEREDTVCFDVPQVEEEVSGTLFIGLRTVAYVGEQEVVLAVEQCSEAMEVLRRDTIHYPLCDADGNALEGGINYHQYESQYLPICFGGGRSATIRIHHMMRRKVVRGITDVGIRIEKLRRPPCNKVKHSCRKG